MAPEDPDAHTLRGKALSLCGETDRALADYSTAINLDPYLPEAYIGRASVLKAKGENEKALADYTKAAELMPSVIAPEEILDPMFPIGASLDEAPPDNDALFDDEESDTEVIDDGESDTAEVIDVKQAVEELLPSLEDAEMGGALADSDELPGPARLKYMALQLKTVSLFESGRHEEAISSASESIELQPDCADNVMLRGMVYLSGLHDHDKAIRDFNKALELDPDNAIPCFALGVVHYEDGRPAEAIHSLSRAIEIEPEHASAHILRGMAHRDIKEYDKALSDLHQGFELKAKLAKERERATQ